MRTGEWYDALLTQGESVVWRGEPQKGCLFTRRDGKNMLGSLPMLAFVAFWCYLVAQNRAWFMLAFGGAMGLKIVWDAFLWPVYRRWQLGRTEYAVTTRRVLRSRSGRVDALDCAALPPVRLEMDKDGLGSIWFLLPHGVRERPGRVYIPVMDMEERRAFILYNLENPVQVMDAIHAAAKGKE